MFWVIVGGASLAGVIGIVALVGSRFPKEHVFVGRVKLRKKPEEVWQVITDFSAQAEWNPLVKAAERLPDRDGHEVWREIHTQGPPVTLETVAIEPPRRLVRSIDMGPGFTGRWEFVLEGSAEGTSLQITEHGVVPNPIFRFMIHVVGPGKPVRDYLRGLAKRLGEPDAPIEIQKGQGAPNSSS